MKAHHAFLHAIMFFTRIPVPASLPYSAELLNRSTRYFPLIGWLVGGFAALVFWAAHFVFPITVAVLLSMIASILLTGAFHEDGLADACDGFGGGWDKTKILTIMKDSRIGTYGTVGLVLALGLKWTALSHLPAAHLPVYMIAGHAFSRFTATTLIFFGTYAREDAAAKSKPLATKMDGMGFFIAAIFGFGSLLLLPNQPMGWLAVLPALAVAWYLMSYFRKWIGGYTGDCLGAVQQVAEILIYLTFLGVTWKSI